MARKRYKPEEIIQILREIEVLTSQGKRVPEAAKQCGIVEQTYYRWRREYGGMDKSEVQRLEKLEQENARLKKLANVGVIVSVEGGQFLTDNRRGEGVYQKALRTILRLKKQGTLSGISVTINKLNFKYWMDSENIDHLVSDGIRLGFFMEYIPSSPNNKSSSSKR